MDFFEEEEVTDQIRQISKYLNGDYDQCYGEAMTSFCNEDYQGTIRSTEISQGILLRTYTITFQKKCEFTLGVNNANRLYILSCHTGNCFISEKSQHNRLVLESGQFFLGNSQDPKTFTIEFPPKIEIKVCLISIIQPDFGEKFKKFNLSSAINETFINFKNNKAHLYIGTSDRMINSITKRILDKKWNKNFVQRLDLEASALQLIVSIIQAHDVHADHRKFSSALSESEFAVIDQITAFLHTHLEQAVSYSTLEEEFQISRTLINRGFMIIHGMSIKKYMEKKRLEKSRKLLVTTSRSISEIMYSVGFENRSKFNKLFKDKYKISPRQLIEQKASTVPQLQLTASVFDF